MSPRLKRFGVFVVALAGPGSLLLQLVDNWRRMDFLWGKLAILKPVKLFAQIPTVIAIIATVFLGFVLVADWLGRRRRGQFVSLRDRFDACKEITAEHWKRLIPTETRWQFEDTQPAARFRSLAIEAGTLLPQCKLAKPHLNILADQDPLSRWLRFVVELEPNSYRGETEAVLWGDSIPTAVLEKWGAITEAGQWSATVCQRIITAELT